VLLEDAFNTKFGRVIHSGVILLLAVISLDFKLACEFYKSLNGECSVATQKEKQRFCTSPRVMIFVGAK